MFYKVSELIDKLNEIKKDGFDKVDVRLIEAEDDLPECLHFETLDEYGMYVDYEEVDAISSDE